MLNFVISLGGEEGGQQRTWDRGSDPGNLGFSCVPRLRRSPNWEGLSLATVVTQAQRESFIDPMDNSWASFRIGRGICVY